MATLTRMTALVCNEKRCLNPATDRLISATGQVLGDYCLPCGALRKAHTDVFERGEALVL